MSDTGEGAHFQGRIQFATAAQRDYVAREHKAVEGGEQTLARLADYLSLRLPVNPD